KVQASRGRDPGERAENDGKGNFTPGRRTGLVPGVQPKDDGRNESDKESPVQWAVEFPLSKESAGSDNTPKDGTVKVYTGDGTGEAIDGVRSADTLDVGKHPVQDTDLGE